VCIIYSHVCTDTETDNGKEFRSTLLFVSDVVEKCLVNHASNTHVKVPFSKLVMTRCIVKTISLSLACSYFALSTPITNTNFVTKSTHSFCFSEDKLDKTPDSARYASI
jgi:hypothetical protein